MLPPTPGKAHREGTAIVQTIDIGPTRQAFTWFESVFRLHGRNCRIVAVDASAKPVMGRHRTGAPDVGFLFGPEEPSHAGVHVSAPQVDHPHPPVHGQPQIGFVRDAEPQPGHFATNCMVHDATHLRGMNGAVLDKFHLDLSLNLQADHALPVAITRQIGTSQ